jgi:hypothetical protein
MPILDLMEQRQSSDTGSVIRGAILAESLKPGTGFDGRGMRIIRCSRLEVTDAANYQPSIWTLIEFEAPASGSDVLASELAGSLLSPGWYANWNSDTEATVVFPGKIFRYPRGDQARRAEVEAYGRSVGVPEPQLDWTDLLLRKHHHPCASTITDMPHARRSAARRTSAEMSMSGVMVGAEGGSYGVATGITLPGLSRA